MSLPLLSGAEARLLAVLALVAVLVVFVFLAIRYSGQECSPAVGPLVQGTGRERSNTGQVCRDRNLFTS